MTTRLLPFTDQTVTFDFPPTVTVNQAGIQTDPTNGATINFTAVFSKAISAASFIASDVTIQELLPVQQQELPQHPIILPGLFR